MPVAGDASRRDVDDERMSAHSVTVSYCVQLYIKSYALPGSAGIVSRKGHRPNIIVWLEKSRSVFRFRSAARTVRIGCPLTYSCRRSIGSCGLTASASRGFFDIGLSRRTMGATTWHRTAGPKQKISPTVADQALSPWPNHSSVSSRGASMNQQMESL